MNDARAMARLLGDLGFEVIAKENLDQKEMKRAIRDFGRKLGQGGVGLFYYAGHGIEVGGENFMVPLNAPIQFEDDVDVEAVSVNLLLAKLASAANRLNIVILDACRNNPYSRSFRSSASGLATMDARREPTSLTPLRLVEWPWMARGTTAFTRASYSTPCPFLA